MKKRLAGWVLVLAALCALGGTVCGQNTTTSGNITAGGSECGAANCVYYQLPLSADAVPKETPWVVVTVSGTWSGSLEIVAISARNANYSNLNTVAWTDLATTTANGTWSVSTNGDTFLLMVATSWTSGTAQIAMAASQTGAPLTNPVLQGDVTAGALTLNGCGPGTYAKADGTGCGNPGGGGVTFPTGVLYGNNSAAAPTVATSSQILAALNTVGSGTSVVLPSGTAGTGKYIDGGSFGWTALPFQSLATAGTSGAAALSGGVLNIPQYQGALTLTTTGSSGAATLSGNTLNIPNYNTGSSFPVGLIGQSLDNTNGSSAYSPSYANTFYQYPDILLFGDSITSGVGCTVAADCYGALLLTDFSGNGVNYAVSGAIAADQSVVMYQNFSPTYTHNPAVTLMIGTNDLSAYGANYGVYTADVQTMLTWATVPRVAKVFGTDSQCTETGTWSNSSSYGFPGGVLTDTTPGDTMTCTIVTQGPALYVGIYQDTAWTAGSMSVTIDGGSPQSVSSLSYYAHTYAYKPQVFRYVVSPGTHTVVFANTSTTSGSTGTVAPAWLGSAYPISTVSPPRIFVADVPPQENNANASLISTYNTALGTLETTLMGDGLPIQPVHETTGRPNNGGAWLLAYNATTNPSDSDYQAATLPGGISCPASTSPGFHPNNCGHAHLRDAFEYYMKPIVLPPTNLVPTVTIAGSAQNLLNLNLTSSYNGGTSLGFYTGVGNGAYTAIKTANQYGGNDAIIFNPSYNTNGPLVGFPYFGVMDAANDQNNANWPMICGQSGSGVVTCNQGSNGAFNLVLSNGAIVVSGTATGANGPNQISLHGNVAGNWFEVDGWGANTTTVPDLYLVGRNSTESINDVYLHCVYNTSCAFDDLVIAPNLTLSAAPSTSTASSMGVGYTSGTPGSFGEVGVGATSSTVPSWTISAQSSNGSISQTYLSCVYGNGSPTQTTCTFPYQVDITDGLYLQGSSVVQGGGLFSFSGGSGEIHQYNTYSVYEPENTATSGTNYPGALGPQTGSSYWDGVNSTAATAAYGWQSECGSGSNPVCTDTLQFNPNATFPSDVTTHGTAAAAESMPGPMGLPEYLVAGLPSASLYAGMSVVVKDVTNAAIGTCTGSGTPGNFVVAVSNGTNWICP